LGSDAAHPIEPGRAGPNDVEHAFELGEVDDLVAFAQQPRARAAGGQGGVGDELHGVLSGKNDSTSAGVTSASVAGFQRGRLSLSTSSARMPSSMSPWVKQRSMSARS